MSVSTLRNIAICSALATACSASFAQYSENATAAVSAANISGQTIDAGGTITVSLEFGTPQPWCGLEIQWGDGQEETVRVGHEKFNKFPLQFSHTYQATGQFTLKIVGKQITRGLKSAGPCGGLPKQTTVTVESAQQKAEVERNRNEANRAKEEADRRARELELKEAELRMREEKLERDRRAQDKKEQELKSRQQVVEQKTSAVPAAPPSNQPAPSKKPAIDPF